MMTLARVNGGHDQNLGRLSSLLNRTVMTSPLRALLDRRYHERLLRQLHQDRQP